MSMRSSLLVFEKPSYNDKSIEKGGQKREAPASSSSKSGEAIAAYGVRRYRDAARS